MSFINRNETNRILLWRINHECEIVFVIKNKNSLYDLTTRDEFH